MTEYEGKCLYEEKREYELRCVEYARKILELEEQNKELQEVNKHAKEIIRELLYCTDGITEIGIPEENRTLHVKKLVIKAEQFLKEE